MIQTLQLHIVMCGHQCSEEILYIAWHACSGAELRNWLLFFALPVLLGILPHQFLNHLAQLVCAIYIFSSEKISEEDFLTAKFLLKEFHKDFSSLYGELFQHCVTM